MRRQLMILVLAMSTVVYVGLVVYTNANSTSTSDSSGCGKKPVEFGIWREYFAERLETEPQEWNGTEELGIILVQNEAAENVYDIYIADEEKALPWMSGSAPMPYALKYEDDFYRIKFLWLSPGLSEKGNQLQIAVGGVLGAGWVIHGTLFLRGRRKE